MATSTITRNTSHCGTERSGHKLLHKQIAHKSSQPSATVPNCLIWISRVLVLCITVDIKIAHHI
jgi:hypothetical protein